jgi:23S rRNA (adenine2503-C2)-methyltransferase
MNMAKKSLCGLTADEINELITSLGFSAVHANTVSISIYKKRISDISDFEKIPFRLKVELINIAVSGIFFPAASEVSTDKTVKYLFRTETGKEFETVYIPDNKRNTVCVSVQSGCRMACSFCATARYGYKGDLTTGEILNQILAIPQSSNITHVVFMGMGEPMDNLENVLKACRIIMAEWGLAISSRNITVSTVGITPGIEQFMQKSECNLTVSLFSPFSEERIKIIPVEKCYPVRNIIEILKNFPVRKKRRFSIAYVMIKGINDTRTHLEELKTILKGSSIRVNLLPYHAMENDPNCSSSPERMQYFKHDLVISGISASIRKSRGADISAACGLLASGLKR